MAGPITATEIDAALKVFYRDGQRLGKIIFDGRNRPFLSQVKKGTDFEGDYIPVPIMYEDAGGGSCTFTKAQENVEEPGLATFQYDVVEYHRVLEVSSKALRKMKSNKGAFLRQMVLKTDTILNALANDLEKSLFRDKSGKFGQVSSFSAGSTSTVTLTNADDTKLWNVGDYVVFANGTENPKTPSASGDGKITAIDRDTGVITINCNVSTEYSSAAEANDYLYREGDYTSSSKVLHLHGLEDHIPTSVSNGESYNNVDRSVDRQRLAGFYKSDGSLSAIYDSMMTLLVKMADQVGPRVDRIFVNHTLWKELTDEIDADVQRAPRDARLGYTYVPIAYPGGEAQVVPCTQCQPNKAWLMSMPTWELISLGKTVGIFDDDGNTILRVYNDSSLEVRAISFPQLICHMPGWNGRIDFS